MLHRWWARGVAALKWDTPLPYSVQWNFGVQRELPGFDRGEHLLRGKSRRQAADQPQLECTESRVLWRSRRCSARVAELNATVPNPFFGIISGGTLAAAQVQRNQLLRAYPHFTGFGNNFVGEGNSTYHALQLSVQKRLSHGLALNIQLHVFEEHRRRQHADDIVLRCGTESRLPE